MIPAGGQIIQTKLLNKIFFFVGISTILFCMLYFHLYCLSLFWLFQKRSLISASFHTAFLLVSWQSAVTLWNAYPTLLALYEFCLRLGWFKDQYNFEPLLLRDLVPWVWSNDQKISAWHITCVVSQLLSGKLQEKIEAESTRWLKKNNKKTLFFLALSQNQHFNPPNRNTKQSHSTPGNYSLCSYSNKQKHNLQAIL